MRNFPGKWEISREKEKIPGKMGGNFLKENVFLIMVF